MYVDVMQEYTSSGTVVTERPNWLMIGQAIRSLDGAERSGISLQKIKSEAHFGVGGGMGKYYVFAVNEDSELFDLINENGSDEEIEIMCGGSPTEFEEWQLTDLSSPLEATQAFANDGTILAHLTWKSRGGSRKPSSVRRDL